MVAVVMAVMEAVAVQERQLLLSTSSLQIRLEVKKSLLLPDGTDTVLVEAKAAKAGMDVSLCITEVIRWRYKQR